MPENWPAYLRTFHDTRAGGVEAVLSRTVSGDHTPYRWLCRAVSGEARRVLDLACGSGPVARELAGSRQWVVGVDVSAAELALSPRPVVRADALRLPFSNEAFDVVTCSMGLMVVQPLPDVLAEVARVLRRGGVFAAIVPAVRPLRTSDVPTLTSLTTRLRSTPQFPAGGEISGLRDELRAAGFDVLESQRERYAYLVRSADDARLLVGSLYLPDTSDARREAAATWLADRAGARGGVEVAIPIRRVVAMRTKLALN
jgi:ubiquinone/menaquinone biosynthesis C-methylase UbiE